MTVFHTERKRRSAIESFCWSLMRSVGFIIVLIMVGCRSPEPHTGPESSGADFRSFPLWFSLDEIVTRKWTQDSGQKIELLHREVFSVKVPEQLEMLVATFGVAGSNQAVCIDFYVAQRAVAGGKTYCLLCHDETPPAYGTKISYEEQNGSSFFNIEGEDPIPGSARKRWRKYYYRLNPNCELMRGLSEFIGQGTE